VAGMGLENMAERLLEFYRGLIGKDFFEKNPL